MSTKNNSIGLKGVCIGTCRGWGKERRLVADRLAEEKGEKKWRWMQEELL